MRNDPMNHYDTKCGNHFYVASDRSVWTTNYSNGLPDIPVS